MDESTGKLENQILASCFEAGKDNTNHIYGHAENGTDGNPLQSFEYLS